MSPVVRRLRLALLSFGSVLVVGTAGYAALGLTALDAFYQTVTTVTTVGFREVEPFTDAGKVFTVVLILVGTGTALYSFSLLLEAIIEGHLVDYLDDRRVSREIHRLSGHTIICGWGRVGQACAEQLAGSGRPVVVVDRDPARLDGARYLAVCGDISEDRTLLDAGVLRADSLIAALDTDADNVFVALSARSLNPTLRIAARARSQESEAKLTRAGADAVINPQLLGGRRLAAFALAPDLADFVDTVVHEENAEFSLAQIRIAPGTLLDGATLGAARIRQRTGALIIGVLPPGCTTADGAAVAGADTPLEAGSTMIALGGSAHLAALRECAASPAPLH